MDAAVDCSETAFGPWNPGITSRIPRDIRHLATLYRPENSFTDAARAEELHDLTGLDCSELVAFRPERLALHELLIRASADFSVPDGEKIEDLGINFRRIVDIVFARHLAPQLVAISAAYDALRQQLSAIIAIELDLLYPAPAATRTATSRSPASRLRGFFARDRRQEAAPDSGVDAQGALVAAWETRARTDSDAMRRTACRVLARVGSALLVRHGRIWGGRDTIAALATDLACNAYGSEAIGRQIEPLLAKAVAAEGFVLLPRQEQPVVMNTKGASASGKSTLRPRQKKLAGEIGVRWSEFALISPDIWRKQLLDYATLGPAYKYGGAFTGEELQIVDQKLDRYMARKAERGEMTHLLIDRFRFDSFAPDSDEAGSNLLTRFGHSVYLFFMITPPESLVERAWKRGLEVGRYKAVDDTLGHGVEAYSGMPHLFFTWVQRTDKRVHFEFLDNSVPLGERPRTVAFGANDSLHVLDVGRMLDVERFRRVNVDASSPGELYPDAELLRPERNVGFLRQCVEGFPEVDFADQATGRIYLALVAGVPVWSDRDALELATADAGTRAGILAAVPTAMDRALRAVQRPRYLREQIGGAPPGTLGAWGPID